MKKFHPFFLSALSGLLLFAAWPVFPLTPLIFIAFVPLLWLEQKTSRAIKFFGWIYLAMLIWNAATTWWVCNSTLPGGISAIMANSLLMSLPWLVFHKLRIRMGRVAGYAAFVLCWLSFEYIHLNWELSWPWLTLGNVFATHPGWIQWYEITGTSGGSLWVLAVNLAIFLSLHDPRRGAALRPDGRQRYTRLISVALLVIPVLVSLAIAPGPAATQANTPNIVVVQPNIDPYEKFAPGNGENELQKLIRLSESQIDSRTALVVWPETAIPDAIDESSIRINPVMTPVWDFLHRHPTVDLLTGVEGYRIFNAANKTRYSFRLPNTDLFEDSYNSAVLLDSNSAAIYHKSKLVPGVESLPSFLKFMASLFDKFGGTTGGYARQEERTVLATSNNSYRIAPSVCYESIYGEFMSSYVQRGADLLVIITNDGWWGKTPGYRQHENYARLRAIETRRWIARSANTGISCFIDPSGSVLDAQPWDKATAIKQSIPPTHALTFYVRHGDILSHLAIALTLALIAWWLIDLIFTRRPSHG